MHRRLVAIAAGVLVAVSAPLASGATDAQIAKKGAGWLTKQRMTAVGQQADRVVALASTGAPRIARIRQVQAMRSSAARYARTAGATGKVLLAVRAARMNPRSLGGVNYVTRLKSQYAGGRFGATTYDQVYGMLGLRAAGERVPAAAIAALRRTRGSGGWGYDLNPRVRDDVSATALVIEASRASGVSARDPMLVAATKWMLAQRNRQGGYGINGRGAPSETNSTALAIRALRAMGRRIPTNTRNELRRLQERDGGFRFTKSIRENRVMATNDAVVALSGKRLPVS